MHTLGELRLQSLWMSIQKKQRTQATGKNARQGSTTSTTQPLCLTNEPPRSPAAPPRFAPASPLYPSRTTCCSAAWRGSPLSSESCPRILSPAAPACSKPSEFHPRFECARQQLSHHRLEPPLPQGWTACSFLFFFVLFFVFLFFLRLCLCVCSCVAVRARALRVYFSKTKSPNTVLCSFMTDIFDSLCSQPTTRTQHANLTEGTK